MFKNIPLSMLRAFEASGRTGSFRNAAEELCLSPSAVSHAIRNLEEHLGTRLFLRSTRRIQLTPEGEALFTHIRRGFDDLRHGMELVSARGPTVLRLHSAPSFAAQWLVPRLARFFTDHPRIDLRLAANTDYARFEADEFDLDIIYGEPKAAGIVVVPLGDELLTPLCAPGMAARIKSPKDLIGLQLIQSESKQIRWPAWLEANGLPVDAPQGARFDRSFLAIAAAADGLGVALESTRLAERELNSGRLVRPLAGKECEIRYNGHYLAYSSAAHQRQTIGVFREWLLAELASDTT
ncbi:LysR substrate-binding domain-containing protein [Paralcaligenes sp. KSB-10]|uniref:LysR substrate-binding domain-containing protein n=1 Tax=Paralcaligenes sp. KSB-10 TaxID=2901142 RepID=UPI001E42435C|nr:LysR substrate-binding domain-containing protein [Paralcaligenes sp. KSB-10]UHL62464.1 LysR substrate-binding domain-containing protein [Paralcaligenes sp. KSB-10]